MKTKNPIPQKGCFIIRLFGEETFHVYVDGKHDCFSCGSDYRVVKSELKKEYPKRKIQFLHIR